MERPLSVLSRVLDHVCLLAIRHGSISRSVKRRDHFDFYLRVAVCNARVLTAYESQRRLTRNYLEGARRRRLQYTPSGLWQAWTDLDAARKVYVGSIAGFVISVSRPHTKVSTATDSNSSFRLSYYSLDPVDSTQTMASSAKCQITTTAAAALNGM